MSVFSECVRLMSLIFFFSSRRRHTRYWRDWSSDVCSSDLAPTGGDRQQLGPAVVRVLGALDRAALHESVDGAADRGEREAGLLRKDAQRHGGVALREQPEALELGERDAGLLKRAEEFAVGGPEQVFDDQPEVAGD